MNILHVVPSFYPAWNYGGPIESGYQLCRHVSAAGCEVRVLTTDADGLDRVLPVDKLRPVMLAPRFSVRYCRRAFRHSVSAALLSQLCSYLRWADIVHLTGVYNFPVIPTLLACRMLRKPLVWSPRGAFQRWRGSHRQGSKRIWEWICRIALRSSAVLHVTSESERVESLERMPGIRTIVIPNGVMVPESIARTPASGPLRLGFLGRLDPKKGIENLLLACRTLSDSGFAYSLVIAGTGDESYTASLRGLIDRLSLRATVEMRGRISPANRADLFQGVDLTVVPSHIENFGNVVVESLAHGVPVIASRGTPWSGLEKIGSGLWVDNDAPSLARAIRRVSAMPLSEMGQKGRDWMLAEFSWDRRACEFLELYRFLAGAQPWPCRDYRSNAAAPADAV